MVVIVVGLSQLGAFLRLKAAVEVVEGFLVTVGKFVVGAEQVVKVVAVKLKFVIEVDSIRIAKAAAFKELVEGLVA